jgi:flagellar basal body-associated protein FliL
MENEDEEEEVREQPKVEKSPKRMVGLLVITVLVLGAAVTGTLLGPRLLTRSAAATESSSVIADGGTPETGEASESEPSNPQAFGPIVVDVKNKRGEMHHMRVGITVELGEKVSKEEFERFQPRGRESAISYLRSKTFEELTEPTEFESITKQLNERVIHAMGERRCSRVVVTDYVAQ